MVQASGSNISLTRTEYSTNPPCTTLEETNHDVCTSTCVITRAKHLLLTHAAKNKIDTLVYVPTANWPPFTRATPIFTEVYCQPIVTKTPAPTRKREKTWNGRKCESKLSLHKILCVPNSSSYIPTNVWHPKPICNWTPVELTITPPIKTVVPPSTAIILPEIHWLAEYKLLP